MREPIHDCQSERPGFPGRLLLNRLHPNQAPKPLPSPVRNKAVAMLFVQRTSERRGSPSGWDTLGDPRCVLAPFGHDPVYTGLYARDDNVGGWRA